MCNFCILRKNKKVQKLHKSIAYYVEYENDLKSKEKSPKTGFFLYFFLLSKAFSFLKY